MRLSKPIIIFFSSILFFSCAKQMPPRGGPEDKTPPSIIQILPKAGATNVTTDTKIEILFSERMLHNTVESSIFISPWPAEEIFYKWKGKKLSIEYSDSLKKNRTYVLTIGAKASDLRNNKMKDSYSMAFSTSDKIDDKQISGTVYSAANVEGTLVCAYLLENERNPDPKKVLADYYTQCNKDGVYNLLYLAPGKYRLFAINDRDLNRKYTSGVDAIGIPNREAILSSENKTIDKVNFKTSIEDTTLLFLKSTYAIDQSKIAVRFSEAVKNFETHTPEKYFHIFQEKDEAERVAILSCYIDAKDAATIHLATSNQKAVSYVLVAQNLFDQAGNRLDSVANSITFEGNAVPDTIQPVIIYKSIADSSKAVKTDTTFQIIFSEAIQKPPFERTFHFLGNDSLILKGKFLWDNPAAFRFLPDSVLKYLINYQFKFSLDSTMDIAGNSLKDSVSTIFFETLAKDTLSAISGTIKDKKENASGKIFLTAKSQNNFYAISIEKPGAYSFENIFPGIYTISLFRDEDGNGAYSFGNTIPFVPAERFIYYPDSIKVRSRWPNEGNDIILE